ncbi:MAG TPA: ATP-binding protein [Bacillota bacterium]|nr:ATP-binding protein [Bacillota bacterium]
MFRKLKLQFILTNLLIITFLFITLTGGAYLVLHFRMMNHAEFFAKRMAEGINSGIFFKDDKELKSPSRFKMDRPPSSPGPSKKARFAPPVVFFVKADQDGEIFFNAGNMPVNIKKLKPVVQKILKGSKESGIIRLVDSQYFYYQTSLTKESGTLVIFQGLKMEKFNQYSLITTLILLGGFYLVLATFGSLFMAKRAISPIQRSWQQQKDFLADASHELRTPLAVIQTNLDVIMGSPEETVASQMDWLTNIKEETEQMAALVSSLLFLARADAHQQVHNKHNVYLDQLVFRVTEAFRPLADQSRVEIVLDLQKNILCYGDEANLRQMLENLLDNALRYTPAEGKIQIGLHQIEKKIRLTVMDTGLGIEAEHLDKIFDRFYQADKSRSKGKAGLGLSIVKSIVENHHGTIRVQSEPGKGTTFTIQFPLAKEIYSSANH